MKNKELINEELNRGNIDILENVFRTYYNQLVRYAEFLTGDAEYARDLVQDTFIQLWKKKTSINIKGSIKAYLFKSLFNLYKNHLKHQSVVKKYKDDLLSRIHEIQQTFFYDHIMDFKLDQEKYKNEITKAINSLPESYKTSFILSRQFNLSNQEIADFLKIPKRTVETNLYRALKYLRDILKNIS